MAPFKGDKHLVGLIYWSIITGVIFYLKGTATTFGDAVFKGVINGAIFYLLMLLLQWLLKRFGLER